MKKLLLVATLLASLSAASAPAKAEAVIAPIVGSGVPFIFLPWIGAMYDNNTLLTSFWEDVCEGIGGTWHPERNDYNTVCEGGLISPPVAGIK